MVNLLLWLLCCFCNCLLLIEAFVAEVDVLKFFEIGFRQLLPAPCGGVGSCVRVDGTWVDGIWTSSFPTSNGTFVVAINCFPCIGTIGLSYFHVPMVPSLITDGDFLIWYH